MGWWGSSLTGLWRAVEAYNYSPLEGPICFRFSSEFDCSSHALESLRALLVALSVSLCQSAETGLGFILCFSFRMRTRSTFHPCPLHS